MENGTEVAGVKDIIVPNNAVVGIGQTTTGQSTNLVICNLNPSSQVGAPLTTNGVLYYDEAADVIFSVDMDPNNPLMFGLYDATDDNGNTIPKYQYHRNDVWAQKSNDSRWEYMVLIDKWYYFSF